MGGPWEEGCHTQFSNLSAKIDGQVAAYFPPKNYFKELKKIPYALPVFEPMPNLSSSCEYFSTPSILYIEEEVVYPCEIDIAIPGMFYD